MSLEVRGRRNEVRAPGEDKSILTKVSSDFRMAEEEVADWAAEMRWYTCHCGTLPKVCEVGDVATVTSCRLTGWGPLLCLLVSLGNCSVTADFTLMVYVSVFSATSEVQDSTIPHLLSGGRPTPGI